MQSLVARLIVELKSFCLKYSEVNVPETRTCLCSRSLITGLTETAARASVA